MWKQAILCVLGVFVFMCPPLLAQVADKDRSRTVFDRLLGHDPLSSASRHFTGPYMGIGGDYTFEDSYNVDSSTALPTSNERRVYALTPRTGSLWGRPDSGYEVSPVGVSLIVGWSSTVRLIEQGHLYLSSELDFTVYSPEETLSVNYSAPFPEIGGFDVRQAEITFHNRYSGNFSVLFGYIFGDRILLFGRVGWSFGEQDITTSVTYSSGNVSGPPRTASRTLDWERGVTLGAGLQTRLWGFGLRVEYVYTDQRKKNQIAWRLPNQDLDTMDLRRTSQGVRAYLLYQF